jgi:hypothetical protein
MLASSSTIQLRTSHLLSPERKSTELRVGLRQSPDAANAKTVVPGIRTNSDGFAVPSVGGMQASWTHGSVRAPYFAKFHNNCCCFQEAK